MLNKKAIYKEIKTVKLINLIKMPFIAKQCHKQKKDIQRNINLIPKCCTYHLVLL